MKDRIKQIRKRLDLTQQEFADKIGIKQNTVATYEMGRTTPSDRAIFSICQTFNVNETWLRTGEGEMFNQSKTSELEALAQKYGLLPGAIVALEKFVGLNPEERQIVLDYVDSIITALSAQQPVPQPIQQPASQSVAAAEAAYIKSLRNAPERTLSVSSITDDTESQAG